MQDKYFSITYQFSEKQLGYLAKEDWPLIG